MIYIDFDGVLVNSAKESFRLLMFVKKEIDNFFSDDKDYLFDLFLKLRGEVGPAWNYNNLYLSLKQNKIFLKTKTPNTDDKIFEKEFFITRSFIKNKYLKKWIDLHNLYEFSFLLSDLLEKKIIEISKIVILTNKDTESVKAIIRQLIPVLTYVKVISMTQFDHNYSKTFFLKENLPPDGKHYFLDDCLLICNDVALNINNSNLQIFLANWGYSKNLEDLNNNVQVTDPDNFIQKLCGD